MTKCSPTHFPAFPFYISSPNLIKEKRTRHLSAYAPKIMPRNSCLLQIFHAALHNYALRKVYRLLRSVPGRLRFHIFPFIASQLHLRLLHEKVLDNAVSSGFFCLRGHVSAIYSSSKWYNKHEYESYEYYVGKGRGTAKSLRKITFYVVWKEIVSCVLHSFHKNAFRKC